jgi:sRNA-binding regulator protein Hfq
MEDKYSLEGRLVSVFLRGGWEFTGMVEFSSKEKVVLISDMGSLVIYKENIVAAMIIDERKKPAEVDPESAPSYNNNARVVAQRPRLGKPEYLEEMDFYGSVIPEDMLEGKSEEPNTTFSLSMSQLKNPKTMEKQNGPTEKDDANRGED